MAGRRRTRPVAAAADAPVAARVLDPRHETLLDVIDHLLNKGVVATGDAVLGVAGIDLVYLRLSALLCAADRILGEPPRAAIRRTSPRRRNRS